MSVVILLLHVHLENHCVKLAGCKQEEGDSVLEKNKTAELQPKTISKQGDGFTHTIPIFSRATKSWSWAGPPHTHTRQRRHSQFKSTASSSAHLDGRILSAYIIRIGRTESVGRCLRPRDKWRTFQMTGAGQPRPVIPLIATHSSAAFLAAISPGAPILSLNLSP